MEASSPPPVRSFLPTILVLLLIGWGGLAALFFFEVPPIAPARWAFFFALVLAVTGTVLPLVALLNRRFVSRPPATSLVIMRQSLWAGIYSATLVWLQYLYVNFFEGVVPISIAFLIALGLIIIEWLLRLRERSQWKPEKV
jgi:hypothetical protein